MSSTNLPVPERFAQFFDKLSESSLHGRDAVTGGAGTRADSYYIVRAADDMGYLASFEPSDLDLSLRYLWADRPDLIALIPDIQSLYNSTMPDEGDSDGEVSPFIYEMF